MAKLQQNITGASQWIWIRSAKQFKRWSILISHKMTQILIWLIWMGRLIKCYRQINSLSIYCTLYSSGSVVSHLLLKTLLIIFRVQVKRWSKHKHNIVIKPDIWYFLRVGRCQNPTGKRKVEELSKFPQWMTRLLKLWLTEETSQWTSNYLDSVSAVLSQTLD